MNVKTIFPIIASALILASCSGTVRRQPSWPEPLPKKSANELVSRARGHLGEPYRYGGLSSHGWDCSGFVRAMYDNTLSINLPRTAHDMYISAIPVPFAKARTGDLVFFNIGAKKPSHVGIYLGDREFIHVSKSRGVVISSLEESYYIRHFIGLRRFPISRAELEK